MRKGIAFLTAIFLAILLLTGCETLTPAQRDALVGALAGSALGAGAGAIAAEDSGKGALAGGVAGAVAGGDGLRGPCAERPGRLPPLPVTALSQPGAPGLAGGP